MRTRFAAALAVLVIGVAAPATSALAFGPAYERNVTEGSYGGRYTGYVDAHAMQTTDRGSYGGCPMSSAAEGNANQAERSVMQYGQTSGGNRC
jgi:hypothetical protein